MNLWKVSTFVLSGCLGLGLVYETAKPAQAEAQPAMRQALAALNNAQTRLLAATHDKGGYRARALKHTQEAIQETEAGIAFDNANKDDRRK